MISDLSLQPQSDTTGMRGDINATTRHIDTTQLDLLNITDLVGNMIVFAVGSSRLDTDAYFNATVLATSLDSAYKLLFALAVSSAFTKEPSSMNDTVAAVEGLTKAITVVRILAILVEVCLSLASVFTIILLLLCWNRNSQLRKDPASLTSVLETMQNDPEVAQAANKFQQHNDDTRLTLRGGKMSVTSHHEGQGLPPTRVDSTFGTKTTLPLVMGFPAGTAFLTILTVVLIIVLSLFVTIQRRGGIDVPSNNPIVTQLVLNYLPVLFATLLEPFWTLLNKELCVLKPFETLQSGDAKAAQSMDLRYTSLPPQMIIWRAAKARHFLLMAVCAAGLSTNILAVVLNALLQLQLTAIPSTGSFLTTFSPTINNLSFSTSDHLYIAEANLSHGTPLPAWVSQNLYFLPFQVNTTSTLGDIQSYKAITPGFGMDMVCTNQTWNDPAYIALPDDEVGQPEIFVNVSNVYCTRQWDTFYDTFDRSNASLEIVAPLGPTFSNATQDDIDVCSRTLAVGCLRAELYPGLDGVSSLFTSFTWMTCLPTLYTAMYEVEVSTSGRVMNYVRKNNKSQNITFSSHTESASALRYPFIAFDAPLNNAGPRWGNNTYRDNWPGFLIKALTGSIKLIDPTLPAPPFEDIAPVVIDLVARLFPIVLSLRSGAFMAAKPGTTIAGTMMVPCNRVFMSKSMFIVTVLLLLLHIVVAVAYYRYRPRPIPTGVADTIAGVLALFDGSGLVKEQVRDKLWPEDWRFGYGKFNGVNDGKPRTGIERRPFLVPLG